MEKFKEYLSLVKPRHIISILETGIEVEKANLEVAIEYDYLSIKHRLADLKIFSLMVSGDLSLENYSNIDVRALIKILTTCIEMEEVNLQVNKCLGNEATCREIQDRISDSRVLASFLMFDILLNH